MRPAQKTRAGRRCCRTNCRLRGDIGRLSPASAGLLAHLLTHDTYHGHRRRTGEAAHPGPPSGTDVEARRKLCMRSPKCSYSTNSQLFVRPAAWVSCCNTLPGQKKAVDAARCSRAAVAGVATLGWERTAPDRRTLLAGIFGNKLIRNYTNAKRGGP